MVDARVPRGAHGVLERSARELVLAMIEASNGAENGAPIDWTVLCDAATRGRWPETLGDGVRARLIACDRPVGGHREALWGLGPVHEAARRWGRPDVLHALVPQLPVGLERMGRLTPARCVVTDHHSSWLGALRPLVRAQALARADAVIMTCASGPRGGELIAPGLDPRTAAVVEGCGGALPAREGGARHILLPALPGAYRVVEGFAHMQPHLDGARLRLLRLVGEAQQPLERALSAARRLGVMPRVEVVDLPAPDPEASEALRQHIAQVDVVALTALPQRAPVTPLDVLAFGAACLVADRAPLRDQGAGAVRPVPDDARDWASTLRAFLRDPLLPADYGARALRRAQAQRWPHVARKTMRIYGLPHLPVI